MSFNRLYWEDVREGDSVPSVRWNSPRSRRSLRPRDIPHPKGARQAKGASGASPQGGGGADGGRADGEIADKPG